MRFLDDISTMNFLLQCFDAVDRTTEKSCTNCAHLYGEHGAIWTGITPDRRLQMDPRDAARRAESTLHVVHKGGRSVWQTDDGRTTLATVDVP